MGLRKKPAKMKSIPRIGYQHARKFTVEPKHIIVFADGRMPAVLATPHLIGELERTAREAVEPFLDENERTVGIEVDIKHMAPSLEGFEVTCSARVLGFQDGEIVFQVEARDTVDLLSRGVHRRKIVDVDRLNRRVEKKRQAKSTAK